MTMKIREIVQEEAAPVAAEPEPTQQDIAQIQGLLGTIDVAKEEPQGLLNKLTGWLKDYPILDKVTDIIPQTRLVKAIASAIDAVEAGDGKAALASLASGLTGSVGKAVGAVNTAFNTGSALAQGDLKGAALAAGGNVAKVAKGVGAATSLAQGDVAGAVGNVSKGAGTVVTALQQKLAPAQPTQTAQAPDELERLKQLAKV